jgi:hypothetical protein
MGFAVPPMGESGAGSVPSTVQRTCTFWRALATVTRSDSMKTSAAAEMVGAMAASGSPPMVSATVLECAFRGFGPTRRSRSDPSRSTLYCGNGPPVPARPTAGPTGWLYRPGTRSTPSAGHSNTCRYRIVRSGASRSGRAVQRPHGRCPAGNGPARVPMTATSFAPAHREIWRRRSTDSGGTAPVPVGPMLSRKLPPLLAMSTSMRTSVVVLLKFLSARL